MILLNIILRLLCRSYLKKIHDYPLTDTSGVKVVNILYRVIQFVKGFHTTLFVSAYKLTLRFIPSSIMLYCMLTLQYELLAVSFLAAKIMASY